MKYIANIFVKNNGGCFADSFDSLEQVREWAKKLGTNGDELVVMKNGDSLGNAKHIII